MVVSIGEMLCRGDNSYSNPRSDISKEHRESRNIYVSLRLGGVVVVSGAGEYILSGCSELEVRLNGVENVTLHINEYTPNLSDQLLCRSMYVRKCL